MLRKRLIFTLVYNDGSFTQSRNFRLQNVGGIEWLEQNYHFQQVAFALDELIVLNVTRVRKEILSFAKVISRLSKNVFIPIAAGGGIRSLEDAEILFQHGADKIVINSPLSTDADLVDALVSKYGAQCIVASIDYKKSDDKPVVFIEDGANALEVSLPAYIQHVTRLNVGEIYLNSIDQDGTGFGYDLDTVESVKQDIKMPLIIAGGAGNETHLIQGLQIEGVSAVATANLFNFIGDGLPNARQKIIASNINLASWQAP